MDAEDVPCSKCSHLPGDAAGSVCFDQKSDGNSKTQKTEADVMEVHPGLGILCRGVSLDCLSMLLVKSACFMGGILKK